MRTAGTFALAIIALGFGLTSAFLYVQLGAEREHARSVQVQQDSDCDCSAPSPPSASSLTPPAAARPLHLPLEPVQAALPATSVSAATSGALHSPSFQMTDEHRDYFARKRYASLFRELGLSDDDITALVPLLRDQDQRANKPIPKSRLAPDGSVLPDPDGPRQSASDQAEVAALIGPERAAKLMESRKSLPGRAQVRMLRAQLEDSNEPLSEQQMQRLIAAQKGRSYGLSPKFVEGEAPEEGTKRMQAWQEENERQVREDAASVLTPGQMKTLDEESAIQKSMRGRWRPLAQPAQATAGAAAP